MPEVTLYERDTFVVKSSGKLAKQLEIICLTDGVLVVKGAEIL